MILRPAERPLSGAVEVPGDKSIAHRSLLLGSLADGPVRIRNLPKGTGILAMRRALAALGVRIAEEEGGWVVSGRGLGRPFDPPEAPLDCAGSATGLRLLAGALAGQPPPFRAVLTGAPRLLARPMGGVARALRAMGADIDLTPPASSLRPDDGCAPLAICGRRPLSPFRGALDAPSAQVKSAILLAGLFADGETRLTDPHGTRDHTERMLGWLSDGAAVEREGDLIRLRPARLAGGREIPIPGDPSAAAFLAACATLLPGSDLRILGVGVNPGRMGFLGALRRMGGKVEIERMRGDCGEPMADLRVRSARLTGVKIEAGWVPTLVDEVPVLAVLAAFAEGETRIEGLASLRHKESNRLECTAEGLRAMGGRASVEGDALVVRGPARLRGGGGAPLSTAGDHRLAMAFAVAALVAEGETVLSDAGCVVASDPDFFDRLGRLLNG